MGSFGFFDVVSGGHMRLQAACWWARTPAVVATCDVAPLLHVEWTLGRRDSADQGFQKRGKGFGRLGCDADQVRKAAVYRSEPLLTRIRLRQV